MTTELVSFLRERIVAQGPMPFAAYMSYALYHPRYGYYSRGPERTGWRGHFVTSAELDPAFGGLWASGFEEIWDTCGRPRGFTVVEIGPGEGGFARAVLDAVGGTFAAALTYRLVERLPALENRQRELLGDYARIEWSRSVTEVPSAPAGVVFANEVVDNLPVHLVEQRGGELREICVDSDGDRLVFVSLPPSSEEVAAFLGRVRVDLPEGHRMEVPLAAQSFAARAAGMVGRGAVVVVDYGADAPDLAARPEGSLLAYSASGVDDDVLSAPGEKDVTAHANWTALQIALSGAGLRVVGPIAQRDVLRSLGLDARHDALRADHDVALAAGRGADALRAVSRRQALGALADPGGLGGLGVMAGLAGTETPAFLSGK
ncbi:MAG TPA: SAM-dependent methyltransferase [Actinomycetota bacterium]